VPVFEQHSIALTRGEGPSLDLLHSSPEVAVDQKESACEVEKCCWEARVGKILDKTILPLKAEFYAREKTPGIQVGNG
jgi:hypothetical protein